MAQGQGTPDWLRKSAERVNQGQPAPVPDTVPSWLRQAAGDIPATEQVPDWLRQAAGQTGETIPSSPVSVPPPFLDEATSRVRRNSLTQLRQLRARDDITPEQRSRLNRIIVNQSRGMAGDEAAGEGLVKQAVYSGMQSALALPRGIASLASKLPLPGQNDRLVRAIDSLITGLEPVTRPGDVEAQAAAQASGTVIGAFTGYGVFRQKAFVPTARATTVGMRAVAPRLMARGTIALEKAAAKTAARIASPGGRAVASEAVKKIPLELAESLVAQGILDPESLSTWKGWVEAGVGTVLGAALVGRSIVGARKRRGEPLGGESVSAKPAVTEPSAAPRVDGEPAPAPASAVAGPSPNPLNKAPSSRGNPYAAVADDDIFMATREEMEDLIKRGTDYQKKLLKNTFGLKGGRDLLKSWRISTDPAGKFSDAERAKATTRVQAYKNRLAPDAWKEIENILSKTNVGWSPKSVKTFLASVYGEDGLIPPRIEETLKAEFQPGPSGRLSRENSVKYRRLIDHMSELIAQRHEASGIKGARKWTEKQFLAMDYAIGEILGKLNDTERGYGAVEHIFQVVYQRLLKTGHAKNSAEGVVMVLNQMLPTLQRILRIRGMDADWSPFVSGALRDPETGAELVDLSRWGRAQQTGIPAPSTPPPPKGPVKMVDEGGGIPTPNFGSSDIPANVRLRQIASGKMDNVRFIDPETGPNQAAANSIASIIQPKEFPSGTRRVAEAVRDFIRAPLGDKKSYTWAFMRRILTLGFNAGDVWKKAVIDAQKDGLKIDPWANPSTLYGTFSGHTAETAQLLRGDSTILPKIGPDGYLLGENVLTGRPTLHNIYKQLEGVSETPLKDLDLVLIAERQLEVLKKTGKNIFPSIDPTDSAKYLSGADPKVRQAANQVNEFFTVDMLEYMNRHGLVTPELKGILASLHEKYFPIDRIFDSSDSELYKLVKELGVRADIPGDVKKMTGPELESFIARVGPAELIRKLHGGEQKIMSPTQASELRVARIARSAKLNAIGTSLARMWDTEQGQRVLAPFMKEITGGAEVDPVIAMKQALIKSTLESAGIKADNPEIYRQMVNALGGNVLSGEPGQRGVLRVFDRGKVRTFSLAPDMAQAFRVLSPIQFNIAVRMLGMIPKQVRPLITDNPVFGAIQAFIGTFHSAFNSNHGFIPGYHTMQGLWNVMKNSPLYKEYQAQGGGYSRFRQMEDGAPPALERIELVKSLGNLTQKFDDINRVMEYGLAKKANASTIEAILAARELDTNFGVRGASQTLNALGQMVMFLNPFLQGVRKMAPKAFLGPVGLRVDPFRESITFDKKLLGHTALAGIAAVGIPSLTLRILADMTDDQDLKDVQQSRTGQFNWAFRNPFTGKIQIIKKPYVIGQVYGNTMEAAWDRLKRDDPDSARKLGQAIWDQVSFNMMPLGYQLYDDLKKNRDSTNDAPIIPRELLDVSPEYQVTPVNKDMVVALTQTFNKVLPKDARISPAKVDFVVRKLSGYTGQDMLRLVETGLSMLGVDKLSSPGISVVTPSEADLPIIGRFYARVPGLNVGPVQQFYREADKVYEMERDLMLLEKSDPVEYERRYQTDPLRAELVDTYRTARLEIGEMRRAMVQIREAPSEILSGDQKKELINEYLRAIVEYTRTVNQVTMQAKREYSGTVTPQSTPSSAPPASR